MMQLHTLVINKVCQDYHLEPDTFFMRSPGRQYRHRGVATNVLLQLGYTYEEVKRVMQVNGNGAVAYWRNQHRNLFKKDARYRKTFEELTTDANSKVTMQLKTILEMNALLKRIGSTRNSIGKEIAINLVRMKPYVDAYEQTRRDIIQRYASKDESGKALTTGENGSTRIVFGKNEAQADAETEILLTRECTISFLEIGKDAVERCLKNNELTGNDLALLMGALIPVELLDSIHN